MMAVALLFAGCAASSVSRMTALDLERKLGQSQARTRYPEEYQSFNATLATAERLSRRGEEMQAEYLYRLALLKGSLLESRTGEHSSDAVNGLSSRQKTAQAEPLPDLRNRNDDRPTHPGGAVESPSADQQADPSPGIIPLPLPEVQVAPSPETNLDSPPPPAVPKALPEALPQQQPEQQAGPPSPPELPGDVFPTADRRRFIGTRGYYTAKKGESLRRVGARLGVDWRRLAKINNLDPKEQLKPGQVIAYDNRKIVPSALNDGIVINIADRTLYLLSNGEVRSAYPVAVGKPPRPDEDENWGTPTGRFIITTKSRDPVWKVPQSIQDEMEQNGKEPVKEVPPGKDNPLGKYAMKTSLSGIVIHSTNMPSSVYSFASHGCIRVMPEHMEKLFPAVELRTPGIIVYQPVKLAVSPDGRVFLEVNRDVYDRYKGNLENEVRKLVARRNVEGKVDWSKVVALLKKKSGIPEEITKHPVEAALRKPDVAGKQESVSFSQDRASISLP